MEYHVSLPKLSAINQSLSSLSSHRKSFVWLLFVARRVLRFLVRQFFFSLGFDFRETALKAGKRWWLIKARIKKFPRRGEDLCSGTDLVMSHMAVQMKLMNIRWFNGTRFVWKREFPEDSSEIGYFIRPVGSINYNDLYNYTKNDFCLSFY